MPPPANLSGLAALLLLNAIQRAQASRLAFVRPSYPCPSVFIRGSRTWLVVCFPSSLPFLCFLLFRTCGWGVFSKPLRALAALARDQSLLAQAVSRAGLGTGLGNHGWTWMKKNASLAKSAKLAKGGGDGEWFLCQPLFKDLSGYCGGSGSRMACGAMGLNPGTRPPRTTTLQVLSNRLVTLSWRGGLLHALSRHGSESRNPAVTEAGPPGLAGWVFPFPG